jgi:4-hydroxybutyryl-CoA dehydratase/vinylacetyl-CoA-Delta-isomerase
MPSERDLRHPELQGYLEKYFRGVAEVPTENRLRILRLIESMTLGTGAVAYRTESMHGAGSPEAQVISIGRHADLDEKISLARALAGVSD